MAKVEKFEDLQCWREARVLVNLVFTISNKGMLSKDFGAKDQFRRAALSVMNNIAEGFARYHKKEFITYVFRDLDYISDNESEQLHNQVNKTKHLTLALIKYLNSNTKH